MKATSFFFASWLCAVLLLGSSVLAGSGDTSAASALGKRVAISPGPAKFRVYVGTYTGPKSKGIYSLVMDTADGKLKPEGLAGEAANPSYLSVHPNGRFLFAAGELDAFAGKRTGAVSAFSIAADSGKLNLLNQQPSGGRGPCHLTVDRTGRYVLVANYSSGSVAVLPVAADGMLGEPTATVQHQGSGPNRGRQEGPHAHSINLSADGRFAVAADLGVDKLFVYRFDPARGSLTANEPPAGLVAPGSGPRHFAFHPDGRHAYVINELTSTVAAFDYDPKAGTLREIQTLSALPAGWSGRSFAAHILVHPSGRSLYASNRGHDSIAVFAVDEKTGRLTVVGHESTQGKNPRNFGIDPFGAWLLAANQNSDSLVLFRVDPRTGRLEDRGIKAEVPSPVCVGFVPLGG
ncbi:MAG: lactonase family protein [Phycisphaerae bacterium]|nr:lactonase family protein [Phycisphaerae bacterium]